MLAESVVQDLPEEVFRWRQSASVEERFRGSGSNLGFEGMVFPPGVAGDANAAG